MQFCDSFPAQVRLVRLQPWNASARTGPATGPVQAETAEIARMGPSFGPIQAPPGGGRAHLGTEKDRLWHTNVALCADGEYEGRGSGGRPQQPPRGSREAAGGGRALWGTEKDRLWRSFSRAQSGTTI